MKTELTGALVLAHPLDLDRSPGIIQGGSPDLSSPWTGALDALGHLAVGPALVYNSGLVNVKPVVHASVITS